MNSRCPILAVAWLWLALSGCSALLASPSLLRNGGFETDSGWSMAGGVSYDLQYKRSGRRSLRVDSTQGVQVKQVVYAVLPGEKWTVCGWVATRHVLPADGAGYAFMAIYQFDAAGCMVEAYDWGRERLCWLS